MSRAQGSGAAALVPLLLAFLREPARERPRYTSGREAIEGGDHVMRFAQGRFPPHVVAKTSPAERLELREAALAFIRQVCLWDDATHYQVLCVRPGARREEVKENYHLLMGLIHPDRRDADSVAWPQDAPQRVNHAYATLMDEQKRREYDATLDRMHATHFPPAGIEAPVRMRARTRRWSRGLVVFAMALAVVAVALLAMEMPRDDDERESRLLGRWDASRSAGRPESSPRFITGSSAALSGDTALTAKRPMELPVLAPLLRALLPRHEAHDDRRVALGSPPPAPEPPSEPPAPQRAADVLAAVPVAEPPSPTPVVAAPRADAAPMGPHLSSKDIESLVVRLIDSYETGRVDDLMALVDSSERGFWSTTLMRNSYSQFFRATRERHLRVASLDWRSSGKTAKAHGEAQLHAEYTDERGTFEGPVSLELEIALRDGQPRIVRLKLFPSAS
ncbi:MAG TPA: J domain-containing protein [Usitatibacter sp.]|nr:J domain-containing protein [Usitatibacter sp.]